MAIDRRSLILGASVGLAAAMVPNRTAFALGQRTNRLLLSACRFSNGRFALVVMTLDGRIERTIPLQGRGHDVAVHASSGAAVAFARRPGRFAMAFNVQTKSPADLFVPPVDRHFYGHGAFSQDGRLLYATENDFEQARGTIGIYDVAAGYSRIGEFESYGVGPHDLLLLDDGKTLVVANGGIETHPDSGRTKLNLASMEPSLCFVDAQNGDLLVRHSLPNARRRLSIRHLAANSGGDVWFGGQWQGDVMQCPALIGTARRDAPLNFLDSSEPMSKGLRGYIGSVALSGDGRWLAASAPRANHIVYFDTEKHSRFRKTELRDGCGVAGLGPSRFMLSSGEGTLQHDEIDGDSVAKQWSMENIAFDNHLRVVSG